MTEQIPEQHSDPQDAGAATAAPAAAETEETGDPVPEGPLFEDDELAQFDADDVQAGGAICKMLSLFFLYTVVVMALVGFWTASTLLD